MRKSTYLASISYDAPTKTAISSLILVPLKISQCFWPIRFPFPKVD
jgi:hypothetical protein